MHAMLNPSLSVQYIDCATFYLVVFDLNFIFLYFATATGESCCGGLRMFGACAGSIPRTKAAKVQESSSTALRAQQQQHQGIAAEKYDVDLILKLRVT